MSEVFGYWSWLLYGSGGKPGYQRFLNPWLCLHAAVGVLLAIVVPVDSATAANLVLFPLAGIFVGLAFAWAGSAQSLMQNWAISRLGDYHPGGFQEYPYIFQTAILTILATMVLWGLVGLRVFDCVTKAVVGRLIVKLILYSLLSVSVRECWQVVLGSQWLLISQREIRDRLTTNERSRASDNKNSKHT